MLYVIVTQRARANEVDGGFGARVWIVGFLLSGFRPSILLRDLLMETGIRLTVPKTPMTLSLKVVRNDCRESPTRERDIGRGSDTSTVQSDSTVSGYSGRLSRSLLFSQIKIKSYHDSDYNWIINREVRQAASLNVLRLVH